MTRMVLGLALRPNSRTVALPEGLEPSTLRLEGACSCPLSYGSEMAERAGFEPATRLPEWHVSSVLVWTTHPPLQMAEAEGFEPPSRRTPTASFPSWCHEPLGHASMKWRKRRESNPRAGSSPTARFRDGCLEPLGHSSKGSPEETHGRPSGHSGDLPVKPGAYLRACSKRRVMRPPRHEGWRRRRESNSRRARSPRRDSKPVS